MTPKSIFIMAAAVGVMLVVLQSCYDVTTLTINNSPAVTTPVSFAKDIVPILNKSCNTAGCHNAGGRVPDLTANVAYSSLTIGNYLNLSKPDQSEVYLYLTGKKTPQMPLGATANPSNLNNLMLAWIQQGAKNN